MKKNLILLSVFLLLGLYSYFFIFKESQPKQIEKSLSLLSVDGIERFSLTSEYGTLRLLNQEDVWWLEEPHKYLAQQEFINKSLKIMNDAVVKESFSLGEDRYGFNPGRAFFEFIYKTGERVRLVVGKAEAAGGHIYVLNKDSGQVFVMHNVWGQFLYYPLSEYYHKALPIPGKQVKNVRFVEDGRLKWSVASGGLKTVELTYGGQVYKVKKARLLWFFNRIREFELENLNFSKGKTESSVTNLSIETDKGNIRFDIDKKNNKISIPSLNVFAEYKPFSLKSLDDELAKVVKSDKK